MIKNGLRGVIVVLWLFITTLPTQVNRAATLTQTVLYAEDFEDGQAQGWQLEPGWSIVQDGNNSMLSGEGHQWARSNQNYDQAYRLSFRLKLIQGTIHLVYHMTDAGRYFIGFNDSGSLLNKQYWPNDFRENLISNGAYHAPDVWHEVEIVGQGANLQFFVDGQQEWSYSDPEPLGIGSFAFETLENSRAMLDDLRVTLATDSAPALPASTQAPAPAGVTQPSYPPASATNFTWVRTGGPLGGLGYDVRMLPGNTNRMYVTDAWAGVHISTDGGLTWSPSNQGITTRVGDSGDGIPVFSLTIDPNHPEIIWIGTQFKRGIFKSNDGGQTWVKMDRGVIENDGITFRGFTVDPSNSDVVYAAAEISSWAWAGTPRQGREFDLTRGVVYKTTDGGQNWKAVWRGENLARYIWIDPRDTNVLFISTGIFDREAANSDPASGLPGGEGVLKSTDGGQTWANVNNGLNNLYVGSLFMSAQNPDILLAGTGNNQYYNAGGVYLSEDSGQSWTQTLGNDIITSVEISASNPQLAYAGSSNAIYRSLDGGHVWLRIVGGDENGWGPLGVRAGFPIDFQVDPANPDRIFANEYGGGNFLSLDGGGTWEDASTGYTGAQVRGIAVDPSQPGRVIAAARSGLFVSYDGGVEWIGISNPPAQVMEWNPIAINPGDPQRLISANNWMSELITSSDGGATWSRTSTRMQNERLGWRVAVFAPSDPSLAYAGTAGYYSAGTFSIDMPGRGISFSSDGGKSWRQVNTELTQDTHITGLAVDYGDPRRVFAATAGKGVVYSPDGGQSWSQLNKGLRVVDLLSIAIHPSDGNFLLAGGSRSGLYRSLDGGQSWKASASGMAPESSVSSIVFDPTNPEVLYAADTHSGVYRSVDAGQKWSPIVDGLRMRSVNALAISADGLHLYAATEGEGVFRLDLNGQPPPAAARPMTSSAAASEAATQVVAEAGAPPAAKIFPCGTALAIPLALLLFSIRRKGTGGKTLPEEIFKHKGY